MKHIIIEGGDRLGKNTLIKGIYEALNYDNITIRHFGKPPKGMTPKESLDFQINAFYKEGFFIKILNEHLNNDHLNYFENVLIWNRSHLGEYVYGQMFRGLAKNDIKTKLLKFETSNLDLDNTYLITLTAKAEFFFSKEDGQSFSQNLEQKERELKLFKDIHNNSLIKNKLLLKVDKNHEYRNQNIILGEALEFLKIGVIQL